MSKSKSWTELPNWQIEEEYAFLDNSSLTEWAWEFLRRSPEYSSDYDMCYGTNKSLAGPPIYYPEKIGSETDNEYITRMVMNDIHYQIIPFAGQCAKKWGVVSMYPPNTPLPRNDLFEATHKLPRIITDLNELEEYSEGIDQYDDYEQVIGTSITPLNNVGIVVFDMNLSIVEQLEQIQERLISLQTQSALTPIEPCKTSGQTGKWKRHIRVLDARRSQPQGTYKKISEVIGPIQSQADNTPHEKRGEKYYKSAITVMKNFHKILLHSPLKV